MGASTVTLWRDRYEAEGVAGLVKDAPRSGRPRTITNKKVAEVVYQITQAAYFDRLTEGAGLQLEN